MDKEYNIFKNGSSWLRMDCHLHTKEDKEFIYNGNKFVKEYVDSLKNQNIRVGFITNHNKFNLSEFKELRKEALKDEIYLLPGVELSVNDGSNGIHCLIVFEYEEWYKNGLDYINQFLTTAFEGKANRENENIRCKYNLNELFDKLSFHRADNRDSFIIMAHVEQASGFLKELDGGRIKQIGEGKPFWENVIAFQKVRSLDKINNLRIWFKDREIAFVEGSDCKNISEVGKAHLCNNAEKKTYIKIGDYNFEAIKYALFDFKNRIGESIPLISNSFIKSATFVGGRLDGQTINLNNNMNSLIGIRGSGKSSILEAIRYTLDISLGDNSQDIEYKKRLVTKFIGAGGKVILEIVTGNKQNYIVEKIFNERSEISQNGIKIPNLKIDDKIIKVVYFGQKDLSSTGGDFNVAFVEKFFGKKTSEINESIFKKNQNIIKIVRELKIVKESILKKGEVISDIAGLKEKLKIFIENKIDERLDKQVSFNKDFAILNDAIKFLENIIIEMRKVVVNNKDGFDSFLNYKSKFNSEIFEKVHDAVSSFKDKFDQIIEIMKTSKDDVANLEKNKLNLEEINNNLKEEFSEIKRKIKLPQINADDYINITKNVNISEAKLKELEKKSEVESNLKKELDQELSEIKALWFKQYTIYNDEAIIVNKKNLSIAIEIEFKGDKGAFNKFLSEILKGSGIYTSNIDKISSHYNDPIEIYYDLNKKESKIKETLNSAEQQLKFRNYVEKQLDSFLTYRVPDKYILKYRGKVLQEHSLGQRASALIIFILSMEENELIMIDQPEDDLDNQSIYKDVIKELIELKNKTQFIFATHNPNIPVLGDSEQVISCNFNNDKIEVKTNSIDNKNTQQEIINIMEGGEDAFTKRKEIYSIWKL